MVRNLNGLGVALAAFFVLSAIAASVASAQAGTLTSDGPVKLTGKNTAGATNAFTASFGGKANKVECANGHATGFKYNVTPHTFIPSDVSTYTGIGEAGTCTVFAPGLPEAGAPATVDQNGCDGVAHLGKTVGVDEYSVTTTVICPENKHVTVTIFASAAKHAENKPFCHITFLQKATDYTGLTVKDNTNGTGRVKGTIEGIEVEKSSGVLCPTEIDANAKLDVDVTIEGRNEAGGSTSISLSHL